MKINQHWLTGARAQESPNYDDRPVENDISLIVVHCISLPPGKFGANFIDLFFCNQLRPQDHPYFAGINQLRVSAHLMIDRKGCITQYVPFNKRAWHAGPSIYGGREKCNDFSIGIELEGTESIPYTEAQYQQLAATSHALLRCYPKLSDQRITGHCDIAPDRKMDPGDSFNWEKFARLLKLKLGR